GGHVAFIGQRAPVRLDGDQAELNGDSRRWLMSSDVCKHCTHAACLDVCPTGALFRTEFGTVVVQEDVCNGCGYCVPACPFGVIDRRHLPDPERFDGREDGRVWKCTLCYDRFKGGHEPACAKACPTDSIQFGPLDELQARADADTVSPALRVADLGRPERFLNMFRVFKVTSPMSVGSWLLAAGGAASGVGALLEAVAALRPARTLAHVVAAALGPAQCTYTA